MAYQDDDDATESADDGMESDDTPTIKTGRALGFILDETDAKKVAAFVIKQREDQNSIRSRNRATWQRSAWWREGRRGVRLDKKQDSGLWEAKLPVGMGSAPPVPNKTDRLCRRLTNTILVDKPYPDCEPAGDNPEDRDAAEFATRYLVVKGSSAELNMARVLRAACDKAQTYASAFGWVTMDPTAGGHRPRTMLAHPMAQSKDDALLDPMTGAEASEDALTERFVASDGRLTDDSTEADLQWLPSPKIRLLTGLQLDFLPASARGMQDAIGVVITDATTLGDLRLLFPKALKKFGKPRLEALCTWRPPNIKDILPPYSTAPDDQKDDQKDEHGDFMDAQVVITTTVYYKSCAEYPYGCYAVIGGDKEVLHKQKWSAMVTDNEDRSVEECLEIPVAQARCLDDDTFDNPYGIGIAEHLGPADEIRNMALGYEMEHMFRSANPIPMLPVGSIVQPKQFLLRDGSPIFVSAGGKPEWENVPSLSPTVPLLRTEMTDEMNDDSGLQQVAQGVNSPSVLSGTHAQSIIAESLKSITNMKDNVGDFYVAANRIILQLARAYCTVPQMLAFVGPNGAFKQREWSRADFRTTKRVSIAKGSFTLHTPLAKQEMANAAFDRKIIDVDDYKELMAGGVSPVLGTQDNPHYLRVRRQIAEWMEGQSDEWTQSQQQAATMPPAMEGAPQPPQAPTPFTNRLPVDLEPETAKIRHRQMGRMMADHRWSLMDEAWRAVYLAEYTEMANAAGIMTVPSIQKSNADQQAAQQQAAQAAAQAEQQAAAQALQLEQQKVAEDAKAKQAQMMETGRIADARLAQERELAMAKLQLEAQAMQESGKQQPVSEMEKADIALGMEQEKAKMSLEAEKAKHQMALEAKVFDAELASATAKKDAEEGAEREASAPALVAIVSALSEVQQALSALAIQQKPARVRTGTITGPDGQTVTVVLSDAPTDETPTDDKELDDAE